MIKKNIYLLSVSAFVAVKVSSMDVEYELDLRDIFGKIVLSQKDLSGPSRMSASEIRQGIYFLQIFNTDHQLLYTQKIVK